MMSDIEIAQSTEMRRINEIADELHIPEEYVENYGRYKAKISLDYLREGPQKNGKLVLVTAITPTPAGGAKLLPRLAWLTDCATSVKSLLLPYVNPH